MKMSKIQSLLAELLGLSPDATETELHQALVDAREGGLVSEAAVMAKVEAMIAELKGSVANANAELLDDLSAKVDKLEEKLAEANKTIEELMAAADTNAEALKRVSNAVAVLRAGRIAEDVIHADGTELAGKGSTPRVIDVTGYFNRLTNLKTTN